MSVVEGQYIHINTEALVCLYMYVYIYIYNISMSVCMLHPFPPMNPTLTLHHECLHTGEQHIVSSVSAEY